MFSNNEEHGGQPQQRQQQQQQQELPLLPEVWHTIFTYLRPRDLCQVALVNHEFHTLSSKDIVWGVHFQNLLFGKQNIQHYYNDNGSLNSSLNNNAAATTTTTCILPGYPCKIIQEGQNHVLFNNRNHNHHHQHHHQRRAKCDEGVIESLLKNQTPVYESQIYDLPNSQSVNVQNYLFPKPGIVANVVTITLVGKNSKQFDHTGYYACVDRVDIQGIPLYEKNP
mmetsp:Transcript_19972/g.28298  ORF Transcript_19972/g.28298 Transcript_19972/m.28298 type:complete len:224 (+) Transcript_19972:132-803(+)